MTRKEENREKEILRAAESEYFVTKAEEFAWIHGAEWADQNPRKGLWDAEKVTEWLENHAREFKYYDSDFADGNIDVEGLIETLTKAMED